MNKNTSIVIGGSAFALTLALILTGCTSPVESNGTPTATSTPTPTATQIVIPDEPVTPETAAPALQEASGLSVEVYSELSAMATALNIDISKEGAANTIATMETVAGKPVTVIRYGTCPAGGNNPGVMKWGISGVLSGNAPVPCGTGWTASFDTALAKAYERAESKGLIPGDYVIVVLG